MELLDIVDKNGMPTGRTVDRSIAHKLGIRHRTAHLWIICRRDGEAHILLQKRSDIKDCHPGCYDISSAGHIPAGMDYIPSAIRELKEELGIDASPNELIYLGVKEDSFDMVFHDKPFRDEHISRIFLLERDLPESAFILQEEEVSEVRWMPLKDCITAVEQNSIPNCIAIDVLYMIRDWCEKNL